MRFFSTREHDRVERELRDARPQPRSNFLHELTDRATALRTGHTRSRIAFALSFATFVIGAFASLGGIGYAAASATSVVDVVKKAVKSEPRAVQPRVARSAARAQYGPETTPVPPTTTTTETSTTQTTTTTESTTTTTVTNPPPNVAGAQTEGGASAPAAQTASAESLPFTGVSLIVTAVLGLTLLAAGLLLRRAETQKARTESHAD